MLEDFANGTNSVVGSTLISANNCGHIQSCDQGHIQDIGLLRPLPEKQSSWNDWQENPRQEFTSYV